MPGSIMVHKHGNSHVEKQGPCEGPDNKPEAFLLVPIECLQAWTKLKLHTCQQNIMCTHYADKRRTATELIILVILIKHSL